MPYIFCIYPLCDIYNYIFVHILWLILIECWKCSPSPDLLFGESQQTIAHHCRFVSPVQLWELNQTDRSNTVDQAVRADGCSQHCVHDHGVDPCECFEQLHMFLIRQTWKTIKLEGFRGFIRQVDERCMPRCSTADAYVLCLYLFRCSPIIIFAFSPSVISFE